MVNLASKVTFGAETADWQERIKTERVRVERAQKIMREHGIASILEATTAISGRSSFRSLSKKE